MPPHWSILVSLISGGLAGALAGSVLNHLHVRRVEHKFHRANEIRKVSERLLKMCDQYWHDPKDGVDNHLSGKIVANFHYLFLLVSQYEWAYPRRRSPWAKDKGKPIMDAATNFQRVVTSGDFETKSASRNTGIIFDATVAYGKMSKALFY